MAHKIRRQYASKIALCIQFFFCTNKLKCVCNNAICKVRLLFSICLLNDCLWYHWTGQNNKGQRRLSKAFYCDGNMIHIHVLLYSHKITYSTFFQPRSSSCSVLMNIHECVKMNGDGYYCFVSCNILAF